MKKTLKNAMLMLLLVASAACLFSFSSSAAGKWITSWSTAQTKLELNDYDEILSYLGSVNARTVITPTASGSKLRVKFSNYYGSENMVITNATVAKSQGDSEIDEDSVVTLTFGGEKGVTIKPGQEVYSDEITFEVSAMKDIAVSVYLKQLSEIKTVGLSGGKTYITYDSSKDYTSKESFSSLKLLDLDDTLVDFLDIIFSIISIDGFVEPSLSFDIMDVIPCVAGIEVYNSEPSSYSVVVLGDSTVANDFPKYLAQYIVASGTENVGVAGKGVIGNRILGENVNYGGLIKGESLIDRLSREVLGADGKNSGNVKYVIVKAGANDIIDAVCADVLKNNPGIAQPTAEDIIGGFKKIFEFCHNNGIKVVVAGITQWKGAGMDYFNTGTANYSRTAAEFTKDWNIALAVNAWLEKTDLHDGYVDLTGVSASSTDAAALNPAYTNDYFNPTGQLANIWAKNFDKALIGVGTTVQGVSLSETSKTIFTGSSATLKATVTPSGAKNKNLTWSSSNTAVAKVNSKGKVTPVGNGTCTITVKTAENGYTASCKIIVKTKPTAITLKSSASTIYTTQKITLTASVLPSSASYKEVKWTTSDKSIATVSSSGVVTGVGKGTVTITATSTYDKSITASCKIKVKKKVSVDNLTLNKTSVSKYKGASFTLVPTVSPSNSTFKDVKWKSSDPSIASVDSNGKVKAIKAGTVTITCTSKDNPLCKAICKVKVKIKTTGVSLSSAKTTMYVTQTKTLTATVKPGDATNKNVTWKSSDKSVATVDSKGKVTAKGVGTAKITATTENGGYKAVCEIKVVKYVPVKKVTLSKTSLTIKDGKSYTLGYEISPAKASNQKVKWYSSDESVATVSSKGVIKAKNPGTVTITCKSKDTGKTAKCTVTVKKVSVKSISFAKSTYSVNYKETLQLTADIEPSNASNKKITWKSSNTAYAKVSSKGKVTGLKAGKTVTITATTADGKKVATCKVKIKSVAVKGVSLNKKTATVNVSKSIALTASFTPSNASNKGLVWKSSDTAVAMVSSKGVVTAVAPGKAVITCKTSDGGYTAKCTITVQSVSVTGVYLDNSSIKANKGAAFYLVPNVLPSDATNKNVTWSSSNKSVATVSSSGKVTTVGVGTCYITVTTKDGRFTAKCKITVI